MAGKLEGKRIVLTQADDFMGPPIAEMFREEGASVIEDRRDLTEPGACESLIAEAGEVDVLIANLATGNVDLPAYETTDARFVAVYEALVFPLHRLASAVLPQMMERRAGKIVVVGSATALRGQKNRVAYGSARGAQHAYVRNLGVESAPHNVQVNATGQIFVENPSYFPPEMIGSPELNARLKDVPAGRLSTGREATSLILYLSSEESNFISGQIFPYAGGWVV
jgi:2-keto-3-deoxy-L-fuconate dehydrogenase